MPIYPGPQDNKIMYPAYYYTPVVTPVVVAPVATAPVQPQVVFQPVQPVIPAVYPVYPAAVVPVATPGCQFFMYNRKRG
ncbi:hypothetical protein MCOR27_001415 [Pyricularia oryzae]|uniref:Uncharacterized protein n=1 Tax=Pyricularia grisea TaxID=148305 RepID=A0ABQ8NM60_PYRGI|nr:hypothetical protein MCOR27_001415 [Pyricularia oryzae]KAI6299238.1 hypothetical protein MCOR33_004768 [Pyricularia grisea]KAI6420957.1 hypothetical protein MCOR24_004488 [Pyricularia oryzae]KAI6494511.1 hypothetical protein MCOR13_007460 [Pyricularia oryzae]KAI6497839.1 hypothetical protein MCOR11_004192 [Pyricularia oryzae]